MPSNTKKITKTAPVSSRVLVALKETLAERLSEDMDLTTFEPMIAAMLERLSEEKLIKPDADADSDSDSDSEEAIEALTADNLALEAKVAELQASLKKAKTAAAPKATLKASKSKSKSKTKSGGERAANNYSSFMALLKYMEQAPEVSGFELVADPQFAATAIKSKERYEEHLDAIMHDGQTLHGQTVTLKQAYDAITAAGSKEQCVDPMFKNAAVRTAILWAMIPAEERPRLVDLGRAAELCR